MSLADWRNENPGRWTVILIVIFVVTLTVVLVL